MPRIVKHWAIVAALGTIVVGWGATAQAQACGNISPNSCSTVPIATNAPFSLTFGAAAGGLADTGFTMVQSHSTNRYPASPTFPATPGYEPGNLSLSGGRLVVTTTRGSFYQTQLQSVAYNTQVNALGVGITNPSLDTVLAVDVINPPLADASNSEQAGLWFGLDEDNYVHLAVANRAGAGLGAIELRREIAGVTSGAAVDFLTANLTSVTTATVRLTLTLDRVTNEVRGSYSSSTGEIGTLGPLRVPPSFLTGQTLPDGTGPVSFGGVYTTSRSNAATPAIPFTFDNFSVASAPLPTPAPVPTLSEWAMILFGVILAGGAALSIQRRRYPV